MRKCAVGWEAKEQEVPKPCSPKTRIGGLNPKYWGAAAGPLAELM